MPPISPINEADCKMFLPGLRIIIIPIKLRNIPPKTFLSVFMPVAMNRIIGTNTGNVFSSRTALANGIY